MAKTNAALYQRIVPGPIRRRFTAKFFVIVLVAMLIAAGVGVYFYTQANATLTDQVEADVGSTASLQANALEHWIDGLRSQTRTLARASAFQAGSPEAVQTALRDHTFQSNIRGVHLIAVPNTTIVASTSDGVESIATGPNPTRFEQLDAPWADRVEEIAGQVQDGVFVSDTPYRLAVYGENTIAFIASLPNVEDRLVVVEAGISSDRLSFGTGGGSGYLTVHDPQAGVDEFVFDGSPEGKVIPSNVQNMTDSGFVDDEVLGFAQVGGTDWTVAAHLSKQEAFSLRDQIGTSLAALVLVPLVVIGGAAAVMGRRTGRTLGRLTDEAEQVRDGNLDTEIRTTRIDEFGRLTGAFDDMRVSLRDRIEEAEQARKEAEVSRAEAMEMSDYLQEKADEYAEIMQQCGAGDLTQRMEVDGENEAMDHIAGEFNEMIEELENTTGQLKSFADEVETAGQQVQQSAETVRDASEQVANSVQKISDDAYEQEERLQEVSRGVDAVAADLEAFAADHPDVEFGDALERIEEVATTLTEVVDLSEETMAEAENVAGAAEQQAAELNAVSERAGDLTRYAAPLREVLDRFETESEHEFYFPTGPGDSTTAGHDE